MTTEQLTQEQLEKLSRAINEKRGYSVKQWGNWFQLYRSDEKTPEMWLSEGKCWLDAPRVCTDREAAMDALEEARVAGLLDNASLSQTLDGSWFVMHHTEALDLITECTELHPTLPIAISLCLASAMGINVEEVMNA